jgi:hypothetical protein
LGANAPPEPAGCPMIRVCRCRLPLDPSDGRYWLPTSGASKPGPNVRAVAIRGQDPALLRWERVDDDGWETQGALAVPYKTLPKWWEEVGHCWARGQHSVVDVTLPLRP